MQQKENTMSSVPLAFLLRDPFHDYAIYIKIGTKYIQFCKNSKEDLERLEKLLRNEVKHVFLPSEDYLRYINYKIFNFKNIPLTSETPLEEILALYEDHLFLLKDALTRIGFKKQQVELVNSLQEKSISLIEASADFAVLFKNFSFNAGKSLILRTFLESQLTVLILSKAQKYDSMYLSRINTALLIKDVLLDELEYSLSLEESNSFYNENILNHGSRVADVVYQSDSLDFKSDLITNLLINHHERPSGSGFPNKINFMRFDLPLAAYSLASQYVDFLFTHEFKSYAIRDCAKEVLKNNMKYGSAINFYKALQLFSLTVLQKDLSLE